MAEKSDGVVVKRKGRLILKISSTTARGKFPGLVKRLANGEIDLIEVDLYGKVVCHITKPSPKRLPVGKVKL